MRICNHLPRISLCVTGKARDCLTASTGPPPCMSRLVHAEIRSGRIKRWCGPATPAGCFNNVPTPRPDHVRACLNLSARAAVVCDAGIFLLINGGETLTQTTGLSLVCSPLVCDFWPAPPQIQTIKITAPKIRALVRRRHTPSSISLIATYRIPDTLLISPTKAVPISFFVVNPRPPRPTCPRPTPRACPQNPSSGSSFLLLLSSLSVHS